MATNKTLSLQADIINNGGNINVCDFYNPVRVPARQKENLRALMLDIDGMQACNRFKWFLSSPTIPADRIEQMLYMRSALVFFKQGTEFRLLPFVAVGNLDTYGFMNKVQPIAYNGGIYDARNVKNFGEEISINKADEKDTTKGVVLFDRQNGFVTSGGLTPLFTLQDYAIEEMVTRFSYLNINLHNSQGKNLILVKDPKQKETVEGKLKELYASDKAFAIVKGLFDVQVINNTIDYQEQSIWEDITSWNNFRLEHLGITNEGLFNKKERELAIQNMTDGASTEYVTDAYYEARKTFVKEVKRVFGDDPDFKKQFGTFEVIDMRINHTQINANAPTTQEKKEGDNNNADVDI